MRSRQVLMIFKTMKKVSTLENFNKFSYGRATGNTTRVIDHAIQLLFEGKTIIAHDAWENGKSKAANLNLFEGILRRMAVEHKHVNLVLERRDLSIRIK